MDEKIAKEEIVETAENTGKEVTEVIGDAINGASEAAESVAEETVEATESVATIGAIASTANQKVNKHLLAKDKLAEAEKKIKSTDEEIEECLAKIDSDLSSFKDAEGKFVENTLKGSQGFLKDLGVADRVLESAPEPKVDLQDPEAKPVEIKSITSGKFKGFILGLLGGVAALGAWCYSSIQILGLPLVPEKLPDIERLTKVLELTSQKLGQGANAALGATVVVVAFLLIVWFIYWLTKTLTASSNLKTAIRTEEETEFYCNKKGECKAQMAKVREHIANAHQTIDIYDVLLAEQNAKLKRAMFVEEVETYEQLHAKTQDEVKIVKKLSSEIERFLETPMAEHGILSVEGIDVLKSVNKSANDYIMEMYK